MILAGAFMIAIAALFLFARLGHYALWDDEAGTALTAIGVWRTGDTSAVLDHNIVAYESGKDLINLKERLMPPLSAYLAAPFIGLLGRSSVAARFPFALCGLACVALMAYWAVRSGRLETLCFLAAALLTNVSFFLFCRQCRYYGLVILASTVLAWLYVSFDRKRWKVALFSFVSLCLFASNYLNWAALYVCLAVDYFIWGRRGQAKTGGLNANETPSDAQRHLGDNAVGVSKEHLVAQYPLKTVDWLIIIGPQIIVGGIIFSIWNPFRILGQTEPYAVAGKLQYVWWCARDIVACEFVSPVLLFVGVGFCLWDKRANPWLFRAIICFLVYLVALALLVQKPPALRGVAAVRYFTPLIPLAIAISVMALRVVYQRSRWAAILLALATLPINLLNAASEGTFARGFRSTIVSYLQELINPPDDPFRLTAQWINRQLSERASVWVLPDYATYPLMFHAPKPVYAWQLTWPAAKPEFEKLPRVHFIGQEPPKYIVGFGPATSLATSSIASWNRPDIKYEQVATIDCFWKDMYRPELFWRTFRPIASYDKTTEAIYVFKLRRSGNGG